ncbi:hypothetical protein THOG10_40152 [Vibrio rotiferianus]|nr:hypothetical protein THOG10_40152 [Vibrio rotiferianus]
MINFIVFILSSVICGHRECIVKCLIATVECKKYENLTRTSF